MKTRFAPRADAVVEIVEDIVEVEEKAPVKFQVEAFAKDKNKAQVGGAAGDEHGERVLSVSLQPPKAKLKQAAVFETQINIRIKDANEAEKKAEVVQ